MNRILKSALLYVALGIVSQSALASGQKITIGLNSWAENIAVAHLWQQLLDTRGYDVTLKTAEEGITWMGVARGQMQMSMDIWLPNTDSAYYKRYKDQVKIIGPWFLPARLGLVVPQYSPIDSIAELREHADEFTVNGSSKPAILGTSPGDSEMKMTRRAIKAYDLPMKLINSSQAAMMAGFKRAYDKHQNIVVTLWSPHWAWASYKLKYLADPKKIYGAGDHIYVITQHGFAEQYPDIQRWVKHWHMTQQQLASLEAAIKKSGTDKGVSQWIQAHSDLVDSWLVKS